MIFFLSTHCYSATSFPPLDIVDRKRCHLVTSSCGELLTLPHLKTTRLSVVFFFVSLHNYFETLC